MAMLLETAASRISMAIAFECQPRFRARSLVLFAHFSRDFRFSLTIASLAAPLVQLSPV
jgi:hypothetical protein